jgi:hypothetical protein
MHHMIFEIAHAFGRLAYMMQRHRRRSVSRLVDAAIFVNVKERMVQEKCAYDKN